MKKLLITILMMIVTTSNIAGALPVVECFAWFHRPDTNEFMNAKLMPVTYDPNYFEVSFNGYTFGADDSYLPENGIGLIVFNNIKRQSSSGTVGFRRIGTSSVYEATLTLHDLTPSQPEAIAGVQCSYRSLDL